MTTMTVEAGCACQYDRCERRRRWLGEICRTVQMRQEVKGIGSPKGHLLSGQAVSTILTRYPPEREVIRRCPVNLLTVGPIEAVDTPDRTA